MSPVWRPEKDPPNLDRFCHLSHDAQRVMVAIFEDYNTRKRELLQSRTSAETATQNARTYYQSIYEARFGPLNNPGNQMCPDNQSQNDHSFRQVAHSNSYSKIRDENFTESNNNDRIVDSWTEDTSTYSDSPPIETQDYRFLSQLTRADVNLEHTPGDANSDLTLNRLTTDIPRKANLGSVTDSNSDFVDDGDVYSSSRNEYDANSNHSTERSKTNGETLKLVDKTSASNSCANADYTNCEDNFSADKAGEDDKASEETESMGTATAAFSQSLFSQDSLNGHTITPNKRKIHKPKACVLKRKAFENFLNLKTKVSNVVPSSGQSGSLSADSGKENNGMGIDTRNLSKACHFQTELMIEDPIQSAEFPLSPINSDHSGQYSLQGYSRQNHRIELSSNSEKEIPTYKTRRIEECMDSIHLDMESPFASDSKAKGTGILAPAIKRPIMESDESPFGPSNPDRDVYDIFKISTKKGNVCKGSSDYATEFSLSSSKKRPGTSKRFTVPMKKLKNSLPDAKPADTARSTSHVIDVSTCSPGHQEEIIRQLLESTEVIVSLLYVSGTTQLRNSIFAQESKKRSGGQKDQDQFRGVAVVSKSMPGNVSVFPFVHNQKPFHQTTRAFLLNLLKGEGRKVGLNVQKVFLEIFKYMQWDITKVDTSWTILDPVIAVWLLDSDNPVNTFDEVLKKVGMPPVSPSDSCIDMIYEDMMLLGVAMERLFKQLQSKELWDLFICVEMKLTPLLAALELMALPVATHTLMYFSEILKQKCTKLEKEAHEAVGHAILLTSPSQLRQVLFEELRLHTKLPSKSRLARTSVGKETSTSESVLTQLVPFHSLPAIVLEYRQVQKLKSTYIDGLLSCVEDGHLRTNWDQTAAATGRVTAYQPNVQAIPKIPVTISRYKDNYIAGRDSDESVDIYARDAFISRPGWTLLAADFQQIELRLLAHLADDPVLLKLFNDQEIPDIFSALTAQWLGKSVDSVTTVDREQTKRVVYSIMYGVGKEKLAEHLKMSVDQAKAIMASFLVKFPAVRKFTQTCIEFCQKHGYCCSIFKRRRLIPNIKHASPVLRAQAERQAVNFCVQGSAADICKAAMIQSVHGLSQRPELKARLLMQIHDELLLEVLDADLGQVADLVKEVMESREELCGSAVKLKVPIPVSLSSGKTWGHMNPVELPL